MEFSVKRRKKWKCQKYTALHPEFTECNCQVQFEDYQQAGFNYIIVLFHNTLFLPSELQCCILQVFTFQQGLFHKQLNFNIVNYDLEKLYCNIFFSFQILYCRPPPVPLYFVSVKRVERWMTLHSNSRIYWKPLICFLPEVGQDGENQITALHFLRQSETCLIILPKRWFSSFYIASVYKHFHIYICNVNV